MLCRKNVIGGRKVDITTQERKVRDMNVEIATFVGSRSS